MLVDDLKAVVEDNKGSVDKIFLRNLLKETLQYYVLDYIYTSTWGDRFLFKGGTCLRFCFDLPRLSEDLDFDFKNYEDFKLDLFCRDIEDYFGRKLQYKDLEIKVTGNQKQVKLKFPIMEDIGLKKDKSETNLLFLRLDMSPVDCETYEDEISLISRYDFNFVINRYSLPDLFSSKIAAILTRTFTKGKGSRVTFKGRDYFDLIWFLERGVQPNFERLEEITGFDKESALRELDEKVSEVNVNYLKEDLAPLFREKGFVDKFAGNFEKFYEDNRKKLDIRSQAR